MVATAHPHQISICFLRAVSRDMKIKRRVCYKINKPLSDLLVFRLIRLKDCPKNFTFSLEVLLLGQMFLIFGQHFSGGHHEPIYQPPECVYLQINCISKQAECQSRPKIFKRLQLYRNRLSKDTVMFQTFKPQKYHIRGLSFSNRLKWGF